MRPKKDEPVLTHCQNKVISALQSGIPVHYEDGKDAKCYYGQGKQERISWATIFKLEDMKLIFTDEDNGFVYLTEKGTKFIN